MAYQVADLPPPEYGNFRFILIDSNSESSDRPGGISSGRSTHLENGNLQIHTDRFLVWELRHTQVADQVAHLPHLENGNLRFTLIDSYPENSGRPAGRSSSRSIPCKKIDNFRFILIDSYSESPGRPVGRSSGRSNSPLINGNLRFILNRFLLWELRQIKCQDLPL